MKLIKRLLKLVGALTVLGGATLVVLIRLEHGNEMTLPKPTGRFSVGVGRRGVRLWFLLDDQL